jgi:hypothetical protein
MAGDRWSGRSRCPFRVGVSVDILSLPLGPRSRQTGRVASITPGTYRHYKGELYEVIDVARHSETEEWLVVYRALYGDRGLWVRPLDMFTESVDVDGSRVPRFALVD